MPLHYEQLSKIERGYLVMRLRQGASFRQIARELVRSASTISREVHRNQNSQGRYYSGYAESLAMKRRHAVRRAKKLDRAPLRRSVERGLKLYWSPEQIEGRRKRQNLESISRMTIYRHLEGSPEQKKYLRGPEKARQHRRKVHERIRNRVMIDERPVVVESRSRVGDWESDTVRGPTHSRCCVMTHVERSTYYLVSRLLAERRARPLNEATVEAMAGLPVETLTVDNGMEFACFKELEVALDANVYFAHEKCPWERGRNENTNRLLRQFFPRGTDFETVSSEQLLRAEKLLNNRPRKALGYRTPKEAMKNAGVALAK